MAIVAGDAFPLCLCHRHFCLFSTRRREHSAADADDSHGGCRRKRNGRYRLRLVRTGDAFHPPEIGAGQGLGWRQRAGLGTHSQQGGMGGRSAAFRHTAPRSEACLSTSATPGSENARAERREEASAMLRWLPWAWVASGSMFPTARVSHPAGRFLIISPGGHGLPRADRFGNRRP